MTYNKYDIEGTDWIEDIVSVRDNELWDGAKESYEKSYEEPNFENILINARFEALTDWLYYNHGEIEYTDSYVNCRDSHFYISDVDGEMIEVNSLEDIQNVVDEYSVVIKN